ncbi:MAG: response regulator [Rhodospirillales bacterium]|nr:response regulator [Rhodospirillales bacterium]
MRGDHVKEAADGLKVLRILKGGYNPDIIITNWEMPKLDGIKLIRMIRDPKESPNPYVPIIMVSAYSEVNRVIQARDAGVSEFLAKPISAQLLYERIATTIEHPRPFVKSESFFGPDR